MSLCAFRCRLKALLGPAKWRCDSELTYGEVSPTDNACAIVTNKCDRLAISVSHAIREMSGDVRRCQEMSGNTNGSKWNDDDVSCDLGAYYDRCWYGDLVINKIYTVKPVFRAAHSDERTSPNNRGSFINNGFLLRNLWWRDTLSGICKCPLKTGFTVNQGLRFSVLDYQYWRANTDFCIRELLPPL